MAKKKAKRIEETLNPEELTDERPDEDVIIDEPVRIKTSIGSFEIKEWTIATFKPLKKTVHEFLHELFQNNIEPTLMFFRPKAYNLWENIVQYQLDDKEIPISKEEILQLEAEYKEEEQKLHELSMIAVDYAVEIICPTLGIKEEDLENMSLEETLALFFTIMDVNGGIVKNVLGLFGRLYTDRENPEEPKQEGQQK